MRMGRTVRRFAIAAGLAWAVAPSAGCRLVPLVKPVPIASPHPPQASPSIPERAEVEIPAIPPLQPISDEEAFAVPTPILDASARRDAALRRVSATVTEVAIAEAPKFEEEPAAATEATGLVPPPAPDSIVAVEPLAEVPATEPATLVFASNNDTPGSWDRDLEHLREKAADQIRRGGPDAEAWAAREKVLSCLLEPGDPTLWNTVFTTLAEPSEASKSPTEEIASPEASPPTAMPALVLSDLRACRKVLGFGRTEPLASPDCRPGQEILLYCEVEGLRDEETPEGYHSRIAARIELVPASGGDPVWQSDLGDRDDVCRRRRRDFFANFRVKIPEGLPIGDYEVRLTLRDGLNNAVASRSLVVLVGP